MLAKCSEYMVSAHGSYEKSNLIARDSTEGPSHHQEEIRMCHSTQFHVQSCTPELDKPCFDKLRCPVCLLVAGLSV
jgi:hypothetical protein